MTSAINYLSINENFPVAGQDNDTQVFRDNFDTIKNNFREAQEEITDLQTYTARVDSDNEFNNFKIVGAVLQRTADAYINNGAYSGAAIDWESGSYQKFIVTGAPEIQFQNFFNSNSELSPRVGKVTLELTLGTGDFSKITFISSSGTTINKIGFPAINTGTYGLGGDLVITSTTEPIFLEVWQHSINQLFIRYLNIASLSAIPDISIGQISDVTIATPSNNDSLRYETIPNKWVNANYDQLITYTVRIGDDGSGSQSVFFINDTRLKTNVGVALDLTFVQGNKYRFNLSDPTNAQGPLKFSTTPDTSVPSPINDYTTGVTRNGTVGTAGAYVDILITENTPNTLYLYAEQIVVDTSNVGGSVKIQKTVNQTYAGSEDLAAGAAAKLTRTASYFTTSAAETATLAAGTEGQIKVFAMTATAEDSSLGDMVITVTNPGWKNAATGTVTFADRGDACTLQYINNKWFCIGNNRAVFA
jgi:hypothetical protein